MPHDVFISHSSVNRKAADAICHTLEQNGVKCWIAPRDIQPGANYGAEIIRGIRDCKVLLLVFSKDANASPAVVKEVELAALEYAKTVIPFRIENVATSENLKFFLAGVHWLDAFPDDTVFDNLVMVVRNALGMPATRETKPAPPLSVSPAKQIETVIIQPPKPAKAPEPADGCITIKGKQYSTSLSTLDLQEMGLRNEDIVPLQYMKNLIELNLCDNQISNLTPLSGLVNLTELVLRRNQISDAKPLSGLVNLTKLSLSFNQISDLAPLSGLVKLKFLFLGKNSISDLSPLAGLARLFYLELAANKISDLSSLSGLAHLDSLYLNDNKINDLLPLSELKKLTSLNLPGNPIIDWSPVAHISRVAGRPLKQTI